MRLTSTLSKRQNVELVCRIINWRGNCQLRRQLLLQQLIQPEHANLYATRTEKNAHQHGFPHIHGHFNLPPSHACAQKHNAHHVGPADVRFWESCTISSMIVAKAALYMVDCASVISDAELCDTHTHAALEWPAQAIMIESARVVCTKHQHFTAGARPPRIMVIGGLTCYGYHHGFKSSAYSRQVFTCCSSLRGS